MSGLIACSIYSKEMPSAQTNPASDSLTSSEDSQSDSDSAPNFELEPENAEMLVSGAIQTGVTPRFCYCLNGRLEVLKEAQGLRPQRWKLFRQDGRAISLPPRQEQQDRYVQVLPALMPGIYSVLIEEESGRVYGNSIFINGKP